MANDTFEGTYHPANFVAGVCDSPTLKQVKDLLDHAAKITKRAQQVTAFANSADALRDAGEKLATGVKKLNDATQKGKTLVGDVSAACAISEAMTVLNAWSLPNSNVSNHDAAKAFDKLFGGAANYFEKLPPPLNGYAKILAEICRVSFFSNMEQLMNITSETTPRGRALQQALDSIDHPNRN